MKSIRLNGRAVSPAVSAVILTGTIVALLSVTVMYVNNRLWASIAEGDFNSSKQFMQTIGLQIDDVAWIPGRKATMRYSTVYGNLSFLPQALNYTVYVKTRGNTDYQFLASYKVGILLFSVPVSRFSLYDGYYDLVYPALENNLTYTGASASVARVFAVEKLTPPMNDGSFVRVVVVPSVRALYSNLTAAGRSTFCTRLYLPVLVQGIARGLSQSVTLTSSSVTAITRSQIDSIMIVVEFPDEISQKGFDASFFHFPSLSQVIDVQTGYDDAIVELYLSEINVELGVHS